VRRGGGVLMNALSVEQLQAMEMASFSHSPTHFAEFLKSYRDEFERSPTLGSRMQLYAALVATGARANQLLPHLEFFCAHAPTLAMSNSLGILKREDIEFSRIWASWRNVASRGDSHPAALANAVEFFSEWDCAEALVLAERVRSAHPTNIELAQLFCLVTLKAHDLRLEGAELATALAVSQQLYPQGAWALSLLARIALEAGANDVARNSANQVLQGRRGYEGGLHEAHTVLGALALGEDQLADALEHLKVSLVEFGFRGPSLRLAQRLTRKGHRVEARSYLEQVIPLWNGPVDKCDVWIHAAENGAWEQLVNPGR
jgi:hypothetical protein